MKKTAFFLIAFFLGFFAVDAIATADYGPSPLEELDPFDAEIERILEKYDKIYQERTGNSPFLSTEIPFAADCQRETCAVWVDVDKSEQTLQLHLDGSLTRTWRVSTGVEDSETPDFDRHPNGRVYDRYDSITHPGGDFEGLGNMPYAVFIDGGFALHGTPQGNWGRLGRRASHGCIRQHPDNAFYFNRLVRKVGIYNTWVTVRD